MIWLWWRADPIDHDLRDPPGLHGGHTADGRAVPAVVRAVPVRAADLLQPARDDSGRVWAGSGYIYLTQFNDTGWWENHSGGR